MRLDGSRNREPQLVLDGCLVGTPAILLVLPFLASGCLLAPPLKAWYGPVSSVNTREGMEEVRGKDLLPVDGTTAIVDMALPKGWFAAARGFGSDPFILPDAFVGAAADELQANCGLEPTHVYTVHGGAGGGVERRRETAVQLGQELRAAAVTFANEYVMKPDSHDGRVTEHRSYAFAGVVFAGEPGQAACLQAHMKAHALNPS